MLDDTYVTQDELAAETGPEGGAEDPVPPPGACTGLLCSPILIDLDREGFRLTSATAGVEFDLDRDGSAERVAWTTAGSGDGWLGLDRNGNGRIDDGGELFGDATDQPESDEPNGYRALAVYDDDGDSRISETDPIYPSLRLWIDANQDGVSQPEELVDLVSVEIRWIDLRYHESRRRDRHGNEFRYRGLVGRGRGITHSVDVFLQRLP